MTRKPEDLTNVAASVRARLFLLSKKQGRDFQSVLKLYFLERLLYRLSVSRYADSFLLKGVLLFFARAGAQERAFTRPTKDIDLEALGMNADLESLKRTFGAIAAIEAHDDGSVSTPTE